MEEKLQQTTALPETPRSREASSEGYLASLRKVITLLGGGVISVSILIAFLTGMIGAWKQYIETWSWAWQAIAWALGAGVPTIFIAVFIARGVRAWFWLMHEREQIAAAKDERERLNAEMNRQNKLADADFAVRMAEAQRILAEAAQIHRTVNFDNLGNAAVIDPNTFQVQQITGNYQPYPNLHSISQAAKGALQQGQQVQGLPAGAMPKPTFDECLRQVGRNSLQLCPGRNLETGEFIITDIPDTHFLLIGTTRKGKSTEVAMLLEQAVKTHNPTHVQLALLDLEDQTCNLFAKEPHVLTLQRQGKRVKAIARSTQEVVTYLGYLVDLMDERYKLTPIERAKLPHILIYLEEFLDLKRRMVSDKKAGVALATAFNSLATRGLKANMHLMVCAQASYSQEDFREAMAQLTGTMLAFSAPPRLAQAAGFMNYALLQKNYLAKTPGQFVFEGTGETCLAAAPEYDLKGKLRALQEAEEARISGGQIVIDEVQEEVLEVRTHPHLIPLASSGAEGANVGDTPSALSMNYQVQPSWQAALDVVKQLIDEGHNQDQIIEKIWKLKKGGNPKYYAARDAYRKCIAAIKDQRQQAYDQASGE
jgi:hypothetical protein